MENDQVICSWETNGVNKHCMLNAKAVLVIGTIRRPMCHKHIGRFVSTGARFADSQFSNMLKERVEPLDED